MKKYNLVNNTLGWLCFVISAVTYLLTIEPTASFWDCPEFIAQGAKLEVGHPPGNPIFMLAARFCLTLFGGDITDAAIAINSMSALLSAATIMLLFWTITHLVRRIIVSDNATDVSPLQMCLIMGGGLCGALAYTWSDTFWYSAVEGEVYAFSSLCTALVFWLILKWENHADEPHSDRYLILIAYVIGVSIAVHLLNLLCIPAIVLVYYYRKNKNTTAKGSLIALGISFVIVALILFGLVPGFVKVAQGFELFFVNTIGMSYNMGVLIYAIVLIAVFVATINALYSSKQRTGMIKIGVFLTLVLSGLTFISNSVWIWVVLILAAAAYVFIYCRTIPRRFFTVGMLSILVIFIGYSSYALLLIRASANTPMNQNGPDNVFTLASYLNREQYGKSPLIYGPVFAENLNFQNVNTGDQTVSIVRFDSNGELNPVPADVTLRSSDGAAIDNGEFKYTKVAKTDPSQPDKYVKESYSLDYSSSPDVNMLFTRMYSTDPEHIKGYKSWSMYEVEDLELLPQRVGMDKWLEWRNQGFVPMYELGPYLSHMEPIRIFEGETGSGDTYVWKPSMMDNIRYFLNYQLNHMYWRYFMWNFAGRQNDIQGNGEPHLGNWISGIPFIDNARLGDQSLLPDEYGKANKGHNVYYMLPLLLGLIGLLWQSLFPHKENNPQRGIEQFWVIFFLFFMTGIAIVLYLNQTPGQPRERDYAFAGSFYAFAIWIGMGVPAISQFINSFFGKAKQNAKDGDNKVIHYTSAAIAVVIGIAVPLQMVSQTWDDHDRSHRYTTRDFGQNYLNSLDENAILFTNGDNDTFPLWYAQEVDGVRTDVRVVNLSYLSTDWYANQMQHPYYDAKAVKFLAQPVDYAYDRLAYSLGRQSNDTVVNAIDGLKGFYASDPIMYGNQPIKVLTTQKMISPIDTAKVYKAFDINPASVDSITKIPYIQDIVMNGLTANGFTLSKLLSFDIVANSINDGFERPVYFATTVPDMYYLNLQPYLNLTGMAYQVTPFANAQISPLADKAYENIMSKFQWGGLDDPKHNKSLYLDETIRRMVASTRSVMVQTAEDLIADGDLPATEFAINWAKENGQPVPANRYDMARNLLNLMTEKLPAEVAPYDGSAEVLTVTDYLTLYNQSGNPEDKAKAEAIIDNALDRYTQLARYALSLSSNQLENMGFTSHVARYYLPMFIGFKNYIALADAVKANPEILEEASGEEDITPEEREMIMNGIVSPDLRVIIYPLLYFKGANADQISELAANYYNNDSFIYGITLSNLHKVAGIDQMKVTEEILGKYGLTPADVVMLNQYIN